MAFLDPLSCSRVVEPASNAVSGLRRPPIASGALALMVPTLAGGQPVAASASADGQLFALGTLSVLAIGAALAMLLAWLRTRRALQRAVDQGRQAQQSLRQLLDSAPAAIWRTDLHGRLLFANRRLCEVLGCSEAELRALPRFFDALDPEAAARMAGRHAQALASGAPLQAQETRIDPDGRAHLFDLIKVRVLDTAGRPEGVISIAADVTEQRTAEARLRQRYALERELLQVSRGLVGSAASTVDAAIQRALAVIGDFAGADRSYLFLMRSGGTRADNTHEWCAEGIEPQIGLLQDCDVDATWPWSAVQLRQGSPRGGARPRSDARGGGARPRQHDCAGHPRDPAAADALGR